MTCLNGFPPRDDADQKAKKSMMPTARKCYIVLRATAFLRKDSL
jgi:hypothetical protein